MEKRENTTEATWQYDAFISYRHSELDSFVAETLHKQLESFKLPVSVIKQKKAELKKQAEGSFSDAVGQSKYSVVKTRIHRVFRDKEELPLVANLADPITDALEQSEYLIVICSPRLNESMWCRKEIETFIAMHDRDHVLAVLVEGEPDTSFPEELLYREEEELQPDGSVIKRKIPVEPLAADVRGTNHKEIKRKIKSELLRLVAPMFDCNYDDLKQRHKEQRTHKIIMTSVSVSAVCLLFGVVSTTMALRIQQQNTRIKEQAVEIAAQADEIEAQYQEVVRSNCVIQAGVAESLLENGDRIGAVETALSVFPKPDREEIPYTAQAAYALSESLRLYENGTLIMPDRLLEADTTIMFVQTSPEGSRLLSVDEFGSLVVWDGASGERLVSLLLPEGIMSEEEQVLFISEDAFFYPTEEGVALYDLTAGENRYCVKKESLYGLYRQISYAEQNDIAVIQGQEGYTVIQGESGKILADMDWTEEDTEVQDACRLSGDGSLYAVSVICEAAGGGILTNEKREVRVYRTADGACLHTYSMPYHYTEHLRFDGEVLYIVNNGETGEETESILDTGNMRGMLYACDLTEESKFLWEYELEGGWFYDTSVASAEGSGHMVCSTYDELLVFDRKTGKVENRFSFGSEVVELGNYVNSNAFLVFVRDGSWHYVDLDTMTDYVGSSFVQCTSTNVKSFMLGNDYWLTLPYRSKVITLYRKAMAPDAQVLCTLEKEPYEAVLSADGSRMAAVLYGDSAATDIVMLDTNTGEVLWEYESEDGYYVGMDFVDIAFSTETEVTYGDYPHTTYLTLVTSDEILILDTETGTKRAGTEHECISPEDVEIYVYGYGYVRMYERDGWYEYCLDAFDAGEQDEMFFHYYSGEELAQDYEWTDVGYKDLCAYAGGRGCEAFVFETEDLLRLYEFGEGWQEEIMIPDINSTYVEQIFFGRNEKYQEENHTDNMLYIVYRDGSVRAFELLNDNGTRTAAETEGFDALEDILCSWQYTQGKDYGVFQGKYDAYLATPEGKLTAHVDGFLSLDDDADVLYMKDRNNIYRVPVYDTQGLYEEACVQLGNKE